MGRHGKFFRIQIRNGAKLQEKGKLAERLVIEACEELKKEGKILEYVLEDRPGSDLTVFFLNGTSFVCDIKSSFQGEFYHRINYKTPALVVPLKPLKSGITKKIRRNLIARIKRNILERGH